MFRNCRIRPRSLHLSLGEGEMEPKVSSVHASRWLLAWCHCMPPCSSANWPHAAAVFIVRTECHPESAVHLTPFIPLPHNVASGETCTYYMYSLSAPCIPQLTSRCELCNTEYREPLRTRLGELIGLLPGNQRPPR